MLAKKIIYILLLSLFLLSCSDQQDNIDVWVIEDTTQIVNDYADTLEWSIQDAKAIKDMIDTKQQDLKQNIQNAYK